MPDEPQLLRVQLRMPTPDLGVNIIIAWVYGGHSLSLDMIVSLQWLFPQTGSCSGLTGRHDANDPD